MNGRISRGHALLVAALVVAAAIATVQERRQSSQIAALTAELAAARAAVPALAEVAPAGPLRLDASERDRLAEAIVARFPRPEGASPPAEPATHARQTRIDEPGPEREASESQRAANDEARRVVESALATRTLRREDVVRLRQLLAEADPQASFELRKRIAAALNRDELRPADATVMLPSP